MYQGDKAVSRLAVLAWIVSDNVVLCQLKAGFRVGINIDPRSRYGGWPRTALGLAFLNVRLLGRNLSKL